MYPRNAHPDGTVDRVETRNHTILWLGSIRCTKLIKNLTLERVPLCFEGNQRTDPGDWSSLILFQLDASDDPRRRSRCVRQQATSPAWVRVLVRRPRRPHRPNRTRRRRGFDRWPFDGPDRFLLPTVKKVARSAAPRTPARPRCVLSAGATIHPAAGTTRRPARSIERLFICSFLALLNFQAYNFHHLCCAVDDRRSGGVWPVGSTEKVFS